MNSFTLTDTTAVSALQLLQQPVLQQQQRLGFLYSKYRLVGKTKTFHLLNNCGARN